MNKNIKNMLLLGAVVAVSGSVSAAGPARPPKDYGLDDAQYRAGKYNTEFGGLTRRGSFTAMQDEANKEDTEQKINDKFAQLMQARIAKIKTAHATASATLADPGAFVEPAAFAKKPNFDATTVTVPSLASGYCTDKGAAVDLKTVDPTTLYTKTKNSAGKVVFKKLDDDSAEVKAVQDYQTQLSGGQAAIDNDNTTGLASWTSARKTAQEAHDALVKKYNDDKAFLGTADEYANKFKLDQSKFNNTRSWSEAKEPQEVREFFAEARKNPSKSLTKADADAIKAVMGFANLGGSLKSQAAKALAKGETGLDEVRDALPGYAVVPDAAFEVISKNAEVGMETAADVKAWFNALTGDKKKVKAAILEFFGAQPAGGGQAHVDPTTHTAPPPAADLSGLVADLRKQLDAANAWKTRHETLLQAATTAQNPSIKRTDSGNNFEPIDEAKAKALADDLKKKQEEEEAAAKLKAQQEQTGPKHGDTGPNGRFHKDKGWISGRALDQAVKANEFAN